jgi:hypothetical protein
MKVAREDVVRFGRGISAEEAIGESDKRWKAVSRRRVVGTCDEGRFVLEIGQ